MEGIKSTYGWMSKPINRKWWHSFLERNSLTLIHTSRTKRRRWRGGSHRQWGSLFPHPRISSSLFMCAEVRSKLGHPCVLNIYLVTSLIKLQYKVRTHYQRDRSGGRARRALILFARMSIIWRRQSWSRCSWTITICSI